MLWREAENVGRRAEGFVCLFRLKCLISRWDYSTTLSCAEAKKSRGI